MTFRARLLHGRARRLHGEMRVVERLLADGERRGYFADGNEDLRREYAAAREAYERADDEYLASVP